MRVGILTDYPSVGHIAGPAIHTRFLKRTLEARGHEVVLMGPDTNGDDPVEGESHLYPGHAYPSMPKVKIPLPASWAQMWDAPRVDLIHGQTNTHMIHYANWMRKMWGIPVVNTHTVHLESYAHFMLSERLTRIPSMTRQVTKIAEAVNSTFAEMYNAGDALVVQAAPLAEYWRRAGVTVPIAVIERPCDPAKFSRAPAEDPYPSHLRAGKRMVVVCRHDNEKRLDHLLRIFATQTAQHDPDVSLTVIGDGLAHPSLVELANRLPHRNRVHFTGLVAHSDLVDWYRYADIFVYASLSETFGNVVNEALWCGLPVIALDDSMGVAHQIEDGRNGFLIAPNRPETDGAFSAACLRLLNSAELRMRMGGVARELSRATTHPDVVASRLDGLYAEAQRHAAKRREPLLIERSVATQKASLAQHLGAWAGFNRALLTFARLGQMLDGGRRSEPALPQAAHRRRPRVATNEWAARRAHAAG